MLKKINIKVSERALLFLCIVLVLIISSTPITQNDTWLQMKIGEIILANKEIPRNNIFSFTEAKNYTFIAHEWIPSVIFAIIHSKYGQAGLIFIKTALALLIFFLMYIICFYINSNKNISLAISMFSFYTASQRMILRPEIFAYIFFLISVILIFQYFNKQQNLYLLFLGLIALLWINSHGSYLILVGIIPIFIIGDLISFFIKKRPVENRINWQNKIRLYIPIGISLLLIIIGIIFLNPFGISLLKHSINLSTSKFARIAIYEWFPTYSRIFINKSFLVFIFYNIFLFLIITSFIINRKKINPTILLLSLIFGGLSVIANRHIAPFALIGSMVLAYNFKDFFRSNKEKKIFFYLLFPIVLSAIFLTLVKGNINKAKVGVGVNFYKKFSESALQYINNNVSGNIFNSYALGAELIYHFYPKIKIVMDSRIDVYGDKYFKWFINIYFDKSKLHKFIKKYNVNHFIILKKEINEGTPLEKNLGKGWKTGYKDKKILIISKN